MLDRLREAVELTKGKTKDELDQDRVLSLAVIHLDASWGT
jgi:hypothetical protein